MRDLLDKVEARQQLVQDTVDRPREQITLPSEQLAAAERALQRLQVTRETVLEPAAEDGTSLPDLLPPGYREVLAAFEQDG
ncbi:hypothetical protein [Kitasatospora sp. NPDC091207]|uniref:hypothetical protein n=1 Tax=Kitasatospora sp. NPDC091207 TaxID=3364083 RepID=UPI0037F7C1DF